MNTLKQGFIVLVSLLFLAVVSIGGAQAANTIASSKSNASFIATPGNSSNTGNLSQGNKTTTTNNSKSNNYRGKDPKTKSINLNSSRSNIY